MTSLAGEVLEVVVAVMEGVVKVEVDVVMAVAPVLIVVVIAVVDKGVVVCF